VTENITEDQHDNSGTAEKHSEKLIEDTDAHGDGELFDEEPSSTEMVGGRPDRALQFARSHKRRPEDIPKAIVQSLQK